MKKVLLSAMLLLALSFNAKAQEIGVRTGDIGGNNVALDAIVGAGSAWLAYRAEKWYSKKINKNKQPAGSVSL